MKKLHLAVVCPVSGMPENTEQLRRAVWTEVAALLQKNQGKFYSSFSPASAAWGVELNVPYGVVLGRDDPLRFVRLAATATGAQCAAIDFHAEALLAGVDPEQVHTVGDTMIFPVFVDGSDPELAAHSNWHLGLSAGELLPDCGIYYMEHRRAVIGPELRMDIAANLANYAMCVVQLEVTA